MSNIKWYYANENCKNYLHILRRHTVCLLYHYCRDSSNSCRANRAQIEPIIWTRSHGYKHVQYVSQFSRYFHKFLFRTTPRQCLTPLDPSLHAILREVFPRVGVAGHVLMSPVTCGTTKTGRNWTYKSRFGLWNKLWFSMWVKNMNIPFCHRYEYRGSAQSSEWISHFKITATASSGEWVKPIEQPRLLMNANWKQMTNIIIIVGHHFYHQIRPFIGNND